MNEQFQLAYIRATAGTDWLSWIGQPILYDNALCVNRTPEEHFWRNKRYGYTPLGI